ncbi:ABC transporter permease [Patescibacteria group bacterium]|nr:ABC transporter permease [Patescibacteria group bacterium]MBU1074612.1 ABC transporter permease [Patescibacteria group bacterium]MBU1952401.1 ABC transporter permease [Patescibacteria group bacterium]
MFTILWRTIKDRKYSLLIYCLSALALIWMYIALLPAMERMADSMIELLSGYPDAFVSMFPINAESFANIENFLAIENYSFMVPILMIFMLTAIAGVSLAGEVETGTAEIILSTPISRVKIFFGKYIYGIIAIAFFSLCSTLSVIPVAKIYDVSYIAANYFTMFGMCLLFGWITFSLAMFLSAIFSEKSRVYMFLGGIYIMMYVVQIVSTLSEQWSDVKYISFFHYYDYEAAIINNSIGASSIWVFGILAIIFTVAGAYWYNRRDFAI